MGALLGVAMILLAIGAVFLFAKFSLRDARRTEPSVASARADTIEERPDETLRGAVQPLGSALQDSAEKSAGGSASPLQRQARIFISYRRDDSADVAGRIYDRLVQRFGQKQVF